MKNETNEKKKRVAAIVGNKKPVITIVNIDRNNILEFAVGIAASALFLGLLLLAAIAVGYDVFVLGASAHSPSLGRALAHAIAGRPVAQAPHESVENLLGHRVLVCDLGWIHAAY